MSEAIQIGLILPALFAAAAWLLSSSRQPRLVPRRVHSSYRRKNGRGG
jgi:hypothetical protein